MRERSCDWNVCVIFPVFPSFTTISIIPYIHLCFHFHYVYVFCRSTFACNRVHPNKCIKWVIKDNDNIVVPESDHGLFYSQEAYVIRWSYRITVVKELEGLSPGMGMFARERKVQRERVSEGGRERELFKEVFLLHLNRKKKIEKLKMLNRRARLPVVTTALTQSLKRKIIEMRRVDEHSRVEGEIKLPISSGRVCGLIILMSICPPLSPPLSFLLHTSLSLAHLLSPPLFICPSLPL